MCETGHRVGHATKNGWAPPQSFPEASSLMPPDDADFLDPKSSDFHLRMRLGAAFVTLCIAAWAVVIMLVRRVLGG